MINFDTLRLWNEKQSIQIIDGLFEVEIDWYHLLETDIDIFIFFTDIRPAAAIRLATATDIPKFAYRYFFRYFKKVFWLKLVRIVYNPNLRQPN